MKQVLTYISPDKDFNEEHKMAVKIQIENSLSLGWKVEDILLVTNFPYEFMGVKATVIEGDDCYCKSFWPATKIYTIVEMFKRGLIGNGLHWYHDFDCFQLAPFDEKEIGMREEDMGITNYGRMPRLCSASIFFYPTAKDIFEKLKEDVDSTKRGEESRLTELAEKMPNRIKKLNITYAFHKFNLLSCYKIVEKPIKAAHFHLTPDKYDFYVRGNNKLGIPLIPERLIKIFYKYGFNK